jgi:predicted enzyme related to lactoylglutathione lyase
VTSRLTNFEIYGEQPEALAAFYRDLFGWEIEKVDGIDYWRIAIGDAGAPLTGGGLTRPPDFGHQGWMPFVEVGSVDDALAIVGRHGGSILKERTAVPRTAWHAVIADPAGNRMLIWEADPTAFPLPEPD